MQRLVNNVRTQLNGAINNSTVTVIIDDASLIQNADIVVCENELMLVTGIASNTLTVTRGYEGSGATTHVDNSIVAIPLTAKTIRNLFDDYNLVGTFASRPSAGFKGRKYTYTDCPWFTYAVDDGTNWLNFNGTRQCHNIMNESGFAFYYQGGATITDDKGCGLIQKVGTTGDVVTIYGKSQPVTPFKLTIGFTAYVENYNYYSIGLGLHNTTADKQLVYGPTAASGTVFRYTEFNNGNAYNGQAGQIDDPAACYLSVEDDGVSRIYRYSLNGIYFREHLRGVNTSFIVGDKIGVAFNVNNGRGNQNIRVFDWLLET